MLETQFRRFLAVLVAGFLAIHLLFTQPGVFSVETSLSTRADAARLRAHVEFLCNQGTPRNSDHPEVLAHAATYIAGQFEIAGARVDRQVFRCFRLGVLNTRM